MAVRLIEALKMAYEAEKDGLKTYLNYAKKTDVIAGKNMFIQLALDEVDHMELIEKYMDELLEGKEFKIVEVPEGRLAAIKPGSKADFKKGEKATLGDEDALRIALEHEKKAGNMYRELSAKEEDATVKAFFDKMADVEDKHLEIIQAELDFMRSEGFWFDTMEFSVER